MRRLLTVVMIAFGLFFTPVFIAAPVHADTAAKQICEGGGGVWQTDSHGATTCAPDNGAGTKLTGNKGFINTIVNALLFLAGILAVIMLISGGVRYIASTGDPKLITQAKDTVLYSVVGLMVVILAYSIVNFISATLK